MGLRDILKKKGHLQDSEPDPATISRLASPEFHFVRSDTHTREPIESAASRPDRPAAADNTHLSAAPRERPHRLSLDVFRGSRSRSASAASEQPSPRSPRSRLSQRLHLHRAPPSSENLPADLPAIDGAAGEAQWEQRATLLARGNERHRASRTPSPAARDGGVVSSRGTDADIQEAIRLHEEGDLTRSTALFARLADPKGANNPLSQVLYGLALRHGWGCEPDPQAAVDYLSAAASNAAAIENLALQAGLNKGGAAKGELVLAIFELANCFRHGWGIPKDPVAAKQYYETAANLGDTDAMNEVAWCYLEGFGTKKDKYAAAKYYQLAERNGSKTLGNTWIWKDKYNPENARK